MQTPTPSPASITVLEALRLAHDEIHHPGATRHNCGQDIDAILREAIGRFAAPAATPADPYVVACHAGQAARALDAAYLAQLEELEATGRRVLMRDGYAGLARQAADLYCALFSLQSDGIRGSHDVDSGPLEDLGGLLQRLADDAREGREAV